MTGKDDDSGEVIPEYAEVPCLPPKQRAEWIGEDMKKRLSFRYYPHPRQLLYRCGRTIGHPVKAAPKGACQKRSPDFVEERRSPRGGFHTPQYRCVLTKTPERERGDARTGPSRSGPSAAYLSDKTPWRGCG